MSQCSTFRRYKSCPPVVKKFPWGKGDCNEKHATQIEAGTFNDYFFLLLLLLLLLRHTHTHRPKVNLHSVAASLIFYVLFVQYGPRHSSYHPHPCYKRLSHKVKQALYLVLMFFLLPHLLSLSLSFSLVVLYVNTIPFFGPMTYSTNTFHLSEYKSYIFLGQLFLSARECPLFLLFLFHLALVLFFAWPLYPFASNMFNRQLFSLSLISDHLFSRNTLQWILLPLLKCSSSDFSSAQCLYSSSSNSSKCSQLAALPLQVTFTRLLFRCKILCLKRRMTLLMLSSTFALDFDGWSFFTCTIYIYIHSPNLYLRWLVFTCNSSHEFTISKVLTECTKWSVSAGGCLSHVLLHLLCLFKWNRERASEAKWVCSFDQIAI